MTRPVSQTITPYAGVVQTQIVGGDLSRTRPREDETLRIGGAEGQTIAVGESPQPTRELSGPGEPTDSALDIPDPSESDEGQQASGVDSGEVVDIQPDSQIVAGDRLTPEEARQINAELRSSSSEHRRSSSGAREPSSIVGEPASIVGDAASHVTAQGSGSMDASIGSVSNIDGAATTTSSATRLSRLPSSVLAVVGFGAADLAALRRAEPAVVTNPPQYAIQGSMDSGDLSHMSAGVGFPSIGDEGSSILSAGHD